MTHSITAAIEVTLSYGEKVTGHQVSIEVTYNFTRGCPEQGPTYDCGGQPAEPDEVDFIRARVIDADGLLLYTAQINDIADDWLRNAGYGEACDSAKGD